MENFSQLKTIENEKRSLLNNQQLDDSLDLNADAVPLDDFDANSSIDLWWQDKKRRWNNTTKESLTEKEEKLLLILLVRCVVFSSMTEDVVNLDSESSTDSESLAEPESDSEANNLLDCWDNWIFKTLYYSNKRLFNINLSRAESVRARGLKPLNFQKRGAEPLQ